MLLSNAALALLTLVGETCAEPQQTLLGSCGRSVAIPAWNLQASSRVPETLAKISTPGFDDSSWHHSNSPRDTVMGALVRSGVFNTEKLFYSDSMRTTIDYALYAQPWLYRKDFTLHPSKGNHYFLQTHGITSKADIWINGKQLADAKTQAGAYGGHVYEITPLVQKQNALGIKAYNTDYQKDFAMSWVDWNPYPPDNGTGVWREVFIKQTGPISITAPRVVTDFKGPVAEKVVATLKTDVQNHEKTPINAILRGTVTSPDGSQSRIERTVQIPAGETRTVTLTQDIKKPQIWWPRQWGTQPLYSIQFTATVGNAVSDISETRKFGIRHITSHVNSHNDTAFQVNGKEFLVLGGGYAPDIFMRWDSAQFERHARFVLDSGLNTIRLEGKQEQPELYDIADRLGLMVISGWECCDKWEAWTYNGDIDGKVEWDAHDYTIANASMRHESAMLQSHPSMLAFFVGSDYWPDDKAAAIYVEELQKADWPNPIICSAAKRGYPAILGPSGMKMDGPYDWVPPNYWYEDKLGAGFGFGSELGAGVGTPELSSLKKFLSPQDMDNLWNENADKGMYHMSGNTSQFHNRTIYNNALRRRYGAPTSLQDYLRKAQMSDYEATRSQFEAYAARVGQARPATGSIYWMLNSAWPSLHWQLWDWYGGRAGAYFGIKTAARVEHVAFDYKNHQVWLINRSLATTGKRRVEVELVGPRGERISTQSFAVDTTGSSGTTIGKVGGLDKAGLVFLRLILKDEGGRVLSRNVYWLTGKVDSLDWDNSTWYYTPVTSFVDYTGLQKMEKAKLSVTTSSSHGGYTVTMKNLSQIPAVFLRMTLVDDKGEDISDQSWDDNYLTIWPGEEIKVSVSATKASKLRTSGVNVEEIDSSLGL